MKRTLKYIFSSRKMLRYCKEILEKLSFDRQLFQKEYQKMKGWLAPEEAAILTRYVAYRKRNNSFPN